MSKRHYVYTLARPDGSVFYVGKGQRARMGNHESEARKGVQSRKCDIIRQIWAEGGTVIREKVAAFDEEEEAYQYEIALINSLGIENLANEANGGHGGARKGAGRPPSSLAKQPVALEDATILMVPVANDLWRRFCGVVPRHFAETEDEYKLLATLLMNDKLEQYITRRQKQSEKKEA